MQIVAQRCGLGPHRVPARRSSPTASTDRWCAVVFFDITQRGAAVNFLMLLYEYSHFNRDILAGRRMGAAARS